MATADWTILHHIPPKVQPVVAAPAFHYNESISEVDQLISTFTALGSNCSFGIVSLCVFGTVYLQLSCPATRRQLFLSLRAFWNSPSMCLMLYLGAAWDIALKSISSVLSLWFLYPILFAQPQDGAQSGPKPRPVAPVDHGVKHLAVIMDGNRRYGRQLAAEAGGAGATSSQKKKSGSAKLSASSPLNGHRHGGDKLMEFIDWSIELGIEILTVYAFSTENWNRSQEEIDVLMSLFELFFEKIRRCAKERGIFIRYVASEPERLPPHILKLMKEVETETRAHSPRRIVVNVCVSYGSRSEIVKAAQSIGSGTPDAEVDEKLFSRYLLRSITQGPVDLSDQRDTDGIDWDLLTAPQLLLRTSGEQRISNFLLYECAYSELAFLQQSWPEVTRFDLYGVLHEFANRHRRFGK